MEIECLHRGDGNQKIQQDMIEEEIFSGTTPNAQWNPLKFCSK